MKHQTAVDLMTERATQELRVVFSKRKAELLDAWLNAYSIAIPETRSKSMQFWAQRIERTNDALLDMGMKGFEYC